MNVFLCLYFGITGDESSTASNHLLVIFVVNLIFYYTYYSIMKYSRGERLHISSCIYFCFGIMFMVPSIYFFTQKEKNSTLSPAESRKMNRECIFLNFFDGHDIW